MSITNLSFDLNLVPAGHALKIKKKLEYFNTYLFSLYIHCLYAYEKLSDTNFKVLISLMCTVYRFIFISRCS